MKKINKLLLFSVLVLMYQTICYGAPSINGSNIRPVDSVTGEHTDHDKVKVEMFDRATGKFLGYNYIQMFYSSSNINAAKKALNRYGLKSYVSDNAYQLLGIVEVQYIVIDADGNEIVSELAKSENRKIQVRFSVSGLKKGDTVKVIHWMDVNQGTYEVYEIACTEDNCIVMTLDSIAISDPMAFCVKKAPENMEDPDIPEVPENTEEPGDMEEPGNITYQVDDKGVSSDLISPKTGIEIRKEDSEIKSHNVGILLAAILSLAGAAGIWRGLKK